MHYISGTNFVIRRQTAGYDRLFKLNQPYFITNILLREDGKVQYKFKTQSGDLVDVTFESCRDADRFIARHRNESLPDYESRYNADRSD